jgi:hypothetical protein
MNPEQIPAPQAPSPNLPPSFGPAADPSPTHTPTASQKPDVFPASLGRQMLYMASYLLLAGLLALAGWAADLSGLPQLSVLFQVSILVFWAGVAIHAAALFIATVASLFRKRWRAAAGFSLCLLAVPLLSCGYCLVGMSYLSN